MKKNILEIISVSALLFGGISLWGAAEEPSGLLLPNEEEEISELPSPNEEMAQEATMEVLQSAMESVGVPAEEIVPELYPNTVHIYTASRQVLIVHRNAPGEGTMAQFMYPLHEIDKNNKNQPVAVQLFNLVREQPPQEDTPWLFQTEPINFTDPDSIDSPAFSPIIGPGDQHHCFRPYAVSLPGNFSTAIQYLLSGFDLPSADNFFRNLWECYNDYISDQLEESNEDGDDSAGMVEDYGAERERLIAQRQSTQNQQAIADIDQRIAAIDQQLDPAGAGTMELEAEPYECDVYINDQYVGHAVNGELAVINGPFVQQMHEATYRFFLELSRYPGLLEKAVAWCREHPVKTGFTIVKFVVSLVLLKRSGEFTVLPEVISDIAQKCSEAPLNELLSKIGYIGVGWILPL